MPGEPPTMRYWTGSAWGQVAIAADATSDSSPPISSSTPRLGPLPWWVAVGSLIAVVAPLVVSRPLLRSVEGANWPIAASIALTVVIAYGPLVAWWVVAARRLGNAPLQAVGLVGDVTDLAWGPLTWLSCLAGQAIMAAVVINTDVPFASNTDGLRAEQARTSYVVGVVMLVVVIAPVVEEIAFRGLVLRGMVSLMHPALAVVLQGVMFGAAHIDPARGDGNIGLVMVLSTVGIVLGAATYLVGRLWPAVIAHAILNGIAMLTVLTGWLTPIET
jgi:hypothetical protein